MLEFSGNQAGGKEGRGEGRMEGSKDERDR